MKSRGNMLSPAFRSLFVALCLLYAGVPMIGGGGEGQNSLIFHGDGNGSRTEAREMIADTIMRNFEPSLEMKEVTDFLLTPALLVQEAVSRGVVLTYPQN